MEMNDLKFKKISKEEVDKLKSLYQGDEDGWQKYREKMYKQLEVCDADVFVVECDDKVVGKIAVNYVNRRFANETIPNIRVFLDGFRLEKEYQGQGLGQKLMSYTIESLQSRGHTEFTTGIQEENEVAKHITYKQGFTEQLNQVRNNDDDSIYTLYLKK